MTQGGQGTLTSLDVGIIHCQRVSTVVSTLSSSSITPHDLSCQLVWPRYLVGCWWVLVGVGGSLGEFPEDPRVGGSIPPLATAPSAVDHSSTIHHLGQSVSIDR